MHFILEVITVWSLLIYFAIIYCITMLTNTNITGNILIRKFVVMYFLIFGSVYVYIAAQ